jgi:hypothetical protein
MGRTDISHIKGGVRPVLLNRGRASTYLRQCRLDALVATSPRHVQYLTDSACWLDSVFKSGLPQHEAARV